MNNHTILGIHLTNRITKASRIQEVLTKYGCSIKTRLGLHEATNDVCSPSGLIILELTSGSDEVEELILELNSITGVEVQKMVFSH
jgi:hypothetical protein